MPVKPVRASGNQFSRVFESVVCSTLLCSSFPFFLNDTVAVTAGTTEAVARTKKPADATKARP